VHLFDEKFPRPQSPVSSPVIMTTPPISVVMPVFNGERFLREAVESILAQTYTHFEFVVINDGSTDGTGAILDSYAASDARVRVYHQDNRGLVDSLNRGCAIAAGKYLAIMHADDLAVRERLEWQIEFMERHAETGVVGGAVEVIDGAGRLLDCWRQPIENAEIQGALLRRNPFVHSAAMMRKEAFLSAGGYRGFFPAEDYDLWLRIAERWRLANLEAAVAKYRIHPDQSTCQKRRQETFCTLAVRAFASLRRDGRPEPLLPDEGITPEVLARLGVNEAAQQRALVADFLGTMASLARASQDRAVIRLLGELRDLASPGPADRIGFSNALLLAARSHYRQGSSFRALGSLGRALATRPAIAARPLKRGVSHILKTVLLPSLSHGLEAVSKSPESFSPLRRRGAEDRK